MAYSFISQSFLIFMYKLTVNLQYISSLSFHLSIKSAHIPLLYLLSEAQSIRSNSQCPLLPCSPCRRLPSDSPSSRRARRAWRPPASYAARATRPSSSSSVSSPLEGPGSTRPPPCPSTRAGSATHYSSLYASLRTNLPREAMGFLDFPFTAGAACHLFFPRKLSVGTLSGGQNSSDELAYKR